MKFGLSIRNAPSDYFEHALESSKVDFVEIAIEDFLFRRDFLIREKLDNIVKRKPVSVHSYTLSILNPESFSFNDLDIYLNFIERLKPIQWSDHFTISSWRAKNLGSLTPGPINNDSLKLVTDRLTKIKNSTLSCPFILENAALPFLLEEDSLTLKALFQVAKESQTGVLLDLSNLIANQINFKIPIEKELECVDWNLVKEIHLAGGEWDKGFFRDTHGANISADSWELFKTIKSNLRPDVLVLIERGTLSHLRR